MQIDFLEDLSPLSEALVQTSAGPPTVYANLPSGSFSIINLAVCFKIYREHWKKSEEPQGFGICALLFGITVTLFHWIPEKRISFLENALTCS